MLLFRPARLASAVALIFSILAAIVATIAFAIDVALTTIARNKIGDATDGNLKVTVCYVNRRLFVVLMYAW